MKNIKALAAGKGKSSDPVSGLVAQIEENLAGREIADRGLTALAIGNEDALSNNHVVETATSVMGTLDDVLSQISAGMESDGRTSFADVQIEAAKIGALLAASPVDALAVQRSIPNSTKDTIVVSDQAGGMMQHNIGLEAYDERVNDRVMEFSIAFNLIASRQDEFGEALFPTVVVGPDEDGAAITVNAVQMYTDFQRDLSGDVDKPKYRLRKIQDAYLDYTVLDYGSLKLVPEYNAGIAANVAKFFDPANTNSTVDVDGVAVTTAPLATGESVSLLGISQNAALISAGVMDVTDALDPFVRLSKVWIETDTAAPAANTKLVLDTAPLTGSTFVPSLQEHHRDTVLVFDNDAILIDAALVDPNVAANSFTVALRLAMSGTGNLETSDFTVYGNKLEIANVYDNATGATVNPTAVPSAAPGGSSDLTAVVATWVIGGYELEAYRTNSNRRTRGNLAKIDRFRYLYPVTPVGTVSALKPFNDSRDDATDLATLVAIVKIKASNAAVTELIRWSNELSTAVTAAQTLGIDPKLHTPASYLVRPFYETATLDLATVVDSIASGNRRNDIRGALMAHISDVVARMISSSGYLHALQTYYGSNPPNPTVIVATDGEIASWLRTDDGLVSTVAGAYDLKVVSTTDLRMSGRMVVTLGIFDANRNSTPNPLNFGFCEWVPEVTVVVPISRNGSVSKELAVDPRFKHVATLPVMADYKVTNFSSVLNKVTLNNAI